MSQVARSQLLRRVYVNWNMDILATLYSSIVPYFTATPASWFDHFSTLKAVCDGGLCYLSPDTLGIVLRAMIPTKRSVSRQVP